MVAAGPKIPAVVAGPVKSPKPCDEPNPADRCSVDVEESKIPPTAALEIAPPEPVPVREGTSLVGLKPIAALVPAGEMPNGIKAACEAMVANIKDVAMIVFIGASFMYSKACLTYRHIGLSMDEPSSLTFGTWRLA